MSERLTRYLPEQNVTFEAQVAVEAALAASRAVRRSVGGTIEQKSGMSNVVTDADKVSGLKIRAVLSRQFPGATILSEEVQFDNSVDPLGVNRLWIVDELDGSKNFADGIENVWISIAYAELGELKVGVAYNPIRNKLYFAEKGQDAYYIGPKYGSDKWVKERIFVSGQDDLSRATVETSMSYDVNQTINHEIIKLALFLSGITPRPREIGSSVEQLCRVAAGISDLHFHSGLKPWDYAAAQVIIREAGGITKGMNGEEFNFLMPHSVSGNELLVDKFIAEVRKIRGNEELISGLSDKVRNFNARK